MMDINKTEETQIQSANNMLEQPSKQLSVSKAQICFVLIVLIALMSVSLNIYWGIKIYKTWDLNIDRKVLSYGQSCSIQSYEISLTPQSGVILNSNPACSKNNSTRLLTSCFIYSPKGQCLYCINFNYYGNCVQYSNRNTNTIVPGLVQTWIKCVLQNIEVIQYGVQYCTEVGLIDVAIETVSNALSTGQITGIAAGSSIGSLALLCFCCMICKK